MTNRIQLLCEGEDHWKDELHGGRADKKKPSDFDAAQLKAGTKEEMEHTDDQHKAEEIAMDHLSEDPDYYKKLKKVETEGASMTKMQDVFRDTPTQHDDSKDESVDEAQKDDFIDYDQGIRHPFLQQKRDNLKKAVEYLTNTLDKHGTPEMKRISAQLKGIENIPADQIKAKLSNAHDLLHKAKRNLASLDSPDKKRDAQAVSDALLALPSALKISSEISAGDKSDKGLWATKVNAYVDDETGDFIRRGTTTYPAGTEKPASASVRKAQAAAAQQAAAVDKRIQPHIRPAGAQSAPKGPVKPTIPTSVANRIKPVIRKKEEGVEESAWFDLACIMEGLQEAPVDWKQSFTKLAKADKKKGSSLKAGNQGQSQYHVPKGAKKPQEPKLARAGGPEDDPLKTASTAEFFETEAGNYFVYRGLNKRYYGMYVSADMKKVTNLGEHGSRAEAIDAMLHHHDKAAAGMGEAKKQE